MRPHTPAFSVKANGAVTSSNFNLCILQIISAGPISIVASDTTCGISAPTNTSRGIQLSAIGSVSFREKASEARAMGWSLKNLLKGSQNTGLHPLDQGIAADRGVPAPGVGLARTSQPGSLSSCSRNAISHAGSLPVVSGPVLETHVAARKHLRRSSMPAMHLGDSDSNSSLLASCGMMTNPPVFDNPLRRRGCCNHKHTQQLQEYRQEAIQRELRVKQAAVSVDDLVVGQLH